MLMLVQEARLLSLVMIVRPLLSTLIQRILHVLRFQGLLWHMRFLRNTWLWFQHFVAVHWTMIKCEVALSW
jgi:hypothetical protein